MWQSNRQSIQYNAEAELRANSNEINLLSNKSCLFFGDKMLKNDCSDSVLLTFEIMEGLTGCSCTTQTRDKGFTTALV